MPTRERYQNPSIGDTVNLRLFTYNNNDFTDLQNIEKVDIYFLDREEVSASNQDGRRLVESFEGSGVVVEDTGTHLIPIELQDKKYTIGRYLDVWTVTVIDGEPDETIENCFDVYPNLLYTTPIPVVYDFSFCFQPNKFRKGSKQYIIIEIMPNVPTAGDLRRYYENLAIVSDLKISIEQNCVPCLPAEEDLRLIADKVKSEYREKRHAYYKLDTEDMECGIYNIWFQLEFGGNVYISDKMQFQIYD